MTELRTPQPHALATRRYSAWRLVRASLYDFWLLLRESWVALAGFALLALIGTLYLLFRYPATSDSPRPSGVAEALYQTLTLLTLQSGLAFPAGDLLGTLLFFLIPLLGLALIFQSVLNFGRLVLDKGSRREQWQIALASTFRGHVIVVGLGRVGLRVTEQLLDAGFDVIAIERSWDGEYVERTINQKVPVVVGDARESATLRSAGLSRARAIVTAINGDLLNVEIALAVRSQRPDIRVVLRIFNDDMDRNLERTFGPNTAFSASALAAPTFAAAAISRGVDFVLPVSGELVGVTRFAPRDSTPIPTFEQQHQVRVLIHQTADGTVLPRSPARTPGAGDQLTILGRLEMLDALREQPQTTPTGVSRFEPDGPYDTVIVCGLGRVGYRVVRQLLRLSPRPRIVVIHFNDPHRPFARRLARLEGVTTVIGDAREPDVLRQAGFERAYSVAALTSDDLVNLQIGLAARRNRPDVHIVLRVFSDVLAIRLAEMFGIRTTYSTSALAAATLAAAAATSGVRHAFQAAGRIYAAERVTIQAGSQLVGRQLGDLFERERVLAFGFKRDEQSIVLPAHDLVVAPGDVLTLLARIDDLERLRTLGSARR